MSHPNLVPGINRDDVHLVLGCLPFDLVLGRLSFDLRARLRGVHLPRQLRGGVRRRRAARSTSASRFAASAG